jgi:outer membrane lipoprotein-sorting protein
MRFRHMTTMLKASASALLLFAAATTLASAQSPAAPPAAAQIPAQTLIILMGPARDQALSQANAALNAATRMQGRFQQIAPDGRRTNGAFYLQRPGQLRFEYDPPATMLIVSDGSVVALQDRALRTTDRTPLRATPLNFILRAQVDLARDARITRVAQLGDWLLVTARDRAGQTDGEITMQFLGGQLRSWDITDATGGHTRIGLSDISEPASFNRSLFRQEDMIDSRRRGPH